MKIDFNIEQLSEGVYLITSDDVPCLVAQGSTVNEAMDIAHDVAAKLLEVQSLRPRAGEHPINAIKCIHDANLPMMNDDNIIAEVNAVRNKQLIQ